MKKQVKYTYTCKECGSKEVSGRVWADLNTNEILDSDDSDDYWCKGCTDFVTINVKEELV